MTLPRPLPLAIAAPAPYSHRMDSTTNPAPTPTWAVARAGHDVPIETAYWGPDGWGPFHERERFDGPGTAAEHAERLAAAEGLDPNVDLRVAEIHTTGLTPWED